MTTCIVTVTRIVPLGAALAAAVDGMGDSDGRDQEFATWYSEQFHRGHTISAPFASIERTRALITECPETESGTAWKTAAQAALDATLADETRPYDLVKVPESITDAFDALADEIQARSPLLTEVADAVRNAIDPHPGLSIAEVRSGLDMLSGIEVATNISDGWCDKHDEYCYADGEPHGRILWSDVDLLLPGISARVHALVGRVLAALPETADYDGGAARGRALP